jgi:MYXO-CTERM domain-containing protein
MRSAASLLYNPKALVAGRARQCGSAWQIVAIATAVWLVPRPANAFTIESPATDGCHEQITLAAWREVQAAFPQEAAALPAIGDDEALIADVPFTVPKSLQTIGPVTLLLGVRDNDVKEHGPTDLKNLTPQASDPSLQMEHCLRAPAQDEPDGSRAAVDACRAFIREKLIAALEGLDEDARPDGNRRERLAVSLAIRDDIEVDVPLFFLNAGRALHAVQDSFTHTFRRLDDLGKITVVLNFVDETHGTLNEATDGPAHATELDVCDDPDPLRAERRALAQEASTVALSAVLDAQRSHAAKRRAIDDMLDTYVAYDDSARCSFDNGWCAAPEAAYGSPTLGCGVAPAMADVGSVKRWGWVVLGALALARWRRREARGYVGDLLAGVLTAGVASNANAAQDTGPIASPAAALAGESDAGAPGKVDKPGAFFARVSIGASYDNAAFSGGLGLRYQFSRPWMIGFDAEWNPYFAITPGELRSGSANLYVSAIRRFQLKHDSVNIRSTVSLGGSMLLFDLVGADKYSLGPFVGISFLGVEWKARRGFYLTIDPTYVAIPIPHLTGVPFMYAQYRFLVGVEFGG